MTNGQKMRKLFEEKKLVVAPGCHDALTAKIISYLGFDAVYMTGYGQSASHLGQPDVGLMTMSEMVMRASNTVEAAATPSSSPDADTGFATLSTCSAPSASMRRPASPSFSSRTRSCPRSAAT